MHTVYLACFFGGLVATVLFAALGALGGAAGHGAGHLHAGHVGQAGHLSHAATPHAHALPAHGVHGTATAQAHGVHGPAVAPAQGAHGHATAPAHGTSVVRGAAGHAPALPSWLAHTFGWTLSWLSPLTLAAAALWFGGAGLVAESALAKGLAAGALLVAVVAALIGASLVRSLMAALLRAGTPPLQADAAGALGTINAPIRSDAAGEVIYTLEGLRRSAVARSVDGRPIPRGTNVVILRRERGVAWVEALDPLMALDEPGGEDASHTANQARGGDLSPP